MFDEQGASDAREIHWGEEAPPGVLAENDVAAHFKADQAAWDADSEVRLLASSRPHPSQLSHFPLPLVTPADLCDAQGARSGGGPNESGRLRLCDGEI